ncbi:MAG TPA: T9SS type A sorting domain-containing protein, partial [Bacteroidia bacterium]|nr:T9SS type A sorting domain-containing protein [Bacteroidia bacterium]
NVTPDSNSVVVWYVNSNMINQGVTYTPSTSIADTIVYTVIDSSTVAGCPNAVSSPLTFSFIVNQTPTLPNITDSSAVYCQSTSLPTLHATGSGAIIWYANSTIGTPLYVGNSFTPDSLPLGTTYIFVKDSSLTNGCFNAGIDSIYITINAAPATPAPPVLSFQSNPITACQSTSWVSVNVTPDSASTPVWYLNNNMIYIGNSYTPPTSLADTIVYTVIDSIAVAGCASVVSSPLTFSFIVMPAPSTPVITDSSGVFCQGAVLPTIHATGSGAIEWTINGQPVHVGNSFTPDSLPVGTTYIFALDSSITNSCFSPRVDSIYITILPDSLPTVSFQLLPDSLPHVYSIDAYYSANVVSAHWYWGDGKDTVSLNPVHTYDSAGVYNICVTAFNACGDSVNYCQNDSVFRTAGTTIISVHVIAIQAAISTVTAQSSVIKIYPNPAQNNFVIETNINEKQNIMVFDINGKLVLSQTINGTTNIDASNFGAGVYNISILNSTGVTNRRLIIVK